MKHQKDTDKIRILITGSRNFDDFNMMRSALEDVLDCYPEYSPKDFIVVHGNARGADKISGYIAQQLGMQVEVHNAQWNVHGKRAGIIRNIQMVNNGADICLAFPLGSSRGTRHCMELSQQENIPTINITESSIEDIDSFFDSFYYQNQ